MALAHTYCNFCGAPFPADAGWPRTCSSCGETTFRNPLPVVVVLLPVGDGVLAIRRAIPPQIGALALPGGFIDYGETWQDAGARELFEETGVRVSTADIRAFRVHSAGDGTLIVFAVCRGVTSEALPPFIPNAECSERVILSAPQPMAFQLHEDMLNLFFDGGMPLSGGE